MNIIGFPGLGIEPFNLNPIAFTIPVFGGLSISWYGIIVTFSILAGIFYSFWRAKKSEGISSDDMMDVAIFSIPAAIIGARAYYVIFNFSNFKTLGSIFNTRQGGLAIYGGLILAFAAAFAVCKFKKLSYLKVTDSVAPGVLLGQLIGRWGNFTNAEAYGTSTELPWRMLISGVGEVHPTFLYESLWNVLGFVLLTLLYKWKKFDGMIILIYVSWYGLGRMFIEQLRTDSLMLGDFRVSQVLGGLCLVGGLILIILLAGQAKIRKLENDPTYEGVYSKEIAKMAETITVEETAQEPETEAEESEEQAENNEELNKEEDSNENK